jgi:ribosomal protein S18 acetylase RimI-like enzyme
MLTIRPYTPSDRDAVIALWTRCGLVHPSNDPQKDLLRKQKVRGDWLLVARDETGIVATVMIGYEGHRGWINYLAVCPNRQRRGYGRQLMQEAERLLRAEGCPKINLQVRTTNAQVLAFYKAVGFIQDDVISLGKRLEHDDR